MKKTYFLSIVMMLGITCNNYLFAQSGQKWSTGGISVNASEFLGTTNFASLIFKTNNTAWMWLSPVGNLGLGISNPAYKLDVNGQTHIKGFTLIDSNLAVLQNITANAITINSFAGNGKKLVIADNAGTLTAFSFGQANQVLYGNGTWGLLPTPPQTYWLQSGSNIYYNQGAVGIGMNNPTEKLEVNGNLKVNGKIFTNAIFINGLFSSYSISSIKADFDTVTISKELFAEKLTVSGNTRIIGDAIVTGTIATSGLIISSKVSSDTMISGSAIFDSLAVAKSMRITSELTAYLVKADSISTAVLAAQQSNPLYIQSGTSTDSTQSTIINANNGGMVGIGTTNPTEKLTVLGNAKFSGNLTTGSLKLNNTLQIDSLAGNGFKFDSLSANSYKLVFADQNGNLVSKISDSYINCFFDPAGTAGQYSYPWLLGGNILKKNEPDYIGTCNSFPFRIYTNGSEKMRITETGNVGIGTENPTAKLTIRLDDDNNSALSIYSSVDNKDNFRVKGNGTVYARDIFVYEPTVAFPDYVFDLNYKKLTLEELEKYINKNKHLPNLLSAEEIKTQGSVSLSDMNNKAFEKIEELTLYIIELNKKIESIQKQNDLLQKQMETIQTK